MGRLLYHIVSLRDSSGVSPRERISLLRFLALALCDRDIVVCRNNRRAR